MQESVMLEKLQEMMKESGAHLEGHFLLTSGNHSSDYMQCALLLRFPPHAEFAGEALAVQVSKYSPDTIALHAHGGLIIFHEGARAVHAPLNSPDPRRHPGPGRARGTSPVGPEGLLARASGAAIPPGGGT